MGEGEDRPPPPRARTLKNCERRKNRARAPLALCPAPAGASTRTHTHKTARASPPHSSAQDGASPSEGEREKGNTPLALARSQAVASPAPAHPRAAPATPCPLPSPHHAPCRCSTCGPVPLAQGARPETPVPRAPARGPAARDRRGGGAEEEKINQSPFASHASSLPLPPSISPSLQAMTQQTGVLAATTTEEKGANARLVRERERERERDCARSSPLPPHPSLPCSPPLLSHTAGLHGRHGGGGPGQDDAGAQGHGEQ